jgi:hypothetical protein
MILKYTLNNILVCALFLTGSCHNPDILPHNKDNFKTYLIPEGKHYCGHTMKATKEEILDFDAIFDESARYHIGDKAYGQSNINKLLGFTDCGTGVHNNSARFGWRWYNERLEILAYCYIDGERKDEFMCHVNLNEENNYKLYIQGDKYVFQVNEHVTSITRSCEGSDRKYYLYPYFGGKISAPHDIKIKVRIH